MPDHPKTLPSSVTVMVNGEEHTVTGARSLLDFLRHLDLDPRAVVVERNRAVVRRDALDATPLDDGDQIEIVHFVGGG